MGIKSRIEKLENRENVNVDRRIYMYLAYLFGHENDYLGRKFTEDDKQEIRDLLIEQGKDPAVIV